jgi:hypothetical protein
VASGVVHAHIGASSEGATHILRVLWSNKERLDDDHILLPGRRRRQQGDAVRALNRWSGGDPVPDAWLAIADEIMSSSHRVSMLSQEILCCLNSQQIDAFKSPLGDRQVKVVLTAHDVASLIPAEWQSALRQGKTWTLTEYSHAVAGLADTGAHHSAYQHFWKRHDYGGIVRRWTQAVGADNVAVVTAPLSDPDLDELWRRFCSATELDPDRYPTKRVRSTSLGAASAEVLRRLNATEVIEALPHQDYASEVDGRLARHILAVRRAQEPEVTLPSEQRDWVGEKAEETIAEIEALGVTVIGSLDDLRPTSITQPYEAPEELPDDVLLAAAMDALGGFAVEHGERRDDVKSKKGSAARAEPAET